MHKVAVIDLGTNTFNLLIAGKKETSFDLIHSEKVGVALGMGGINNDFISDDAFLRGIDTLVKFKEICDSFQVERIIAIGTSALRDASNKKQFVTQAKKLTEVDIQIISGDREAELIYKGVKWSFSFIQPTLIMDIGGGSTEFIYADSKGILEKNSFNIGVSRIFQEFYFSDPFSLEDIDKIKNWLDRNTNHFFDGKKCSVLIGASGSFETFHEMIHRKKFEETVMALEFPFEELKEKLKWIMFSTQKERNEHPFIIPIRRKMAPIAAVKTMWLIEKLGISQTYVTPCALKEGVLFEVFVEGL